MLKSTVYFWLLFWMMQTLKFKTNFNLIPFLFSLPFEVIIFGECKSNGAEMTQNFAIFMKWSNRCHGSFMTTILEVGQEKHPGFSFKRLWLWGKIHVSLNEILCAQGAPHVAIFYEITLLFMQLRWKKIMLAPYQKLINWIVKSKFYDTTW